MSKQGLILEGLKDKDIKFVSEVLILMDDKGKEITRIENTDDFAYNNNMIRILMQKNSAKTARIERTYKL